MNQPPTLPHPPAPTGSDRPNPGITIRIPKPNWQVAVLTLIALIAAFQTVQLIRLKGSVTPAVASAPAASASGSSAASGLQSQVGGC